MEYLFGTRSGGWQDQDKERAAQAEEEKKKANAANRREKARVKALLEAATNQPQEVPLPTVQPPVNIPTPPQDQSGETAPEQQSPQQEQSGGGAAGGTGGDQDGSDDPDHNNEPNMSPPQIFEDENGVDDEDWYKKKVEVKWDQKDLLFFFNQLEDAMSFAGIRKQYTKRRVLVTNLPKKQVDDLKGLLRLNEASAGTTPYKTAKNRLIELYGPKEEDAYGRATNLLLTDLPSQLAKQIADQMCTCQPHMPADCCAVRAVAGIWRLQLPQVVKTQIAGKSLAGPEFETTLKLADDVFRSIQTPSVSATEAGANTSEVEALTSQRGGQARGRGQGARGQRGRGGRGRGAATAANQPDQEKTEKEKPPAGCCRQHQRYGKKAFYCMLPTKCPWKQYINDPEQNK